ncbi:Hsp20/alpha crystallin family protein [Alkalilacustris brevis]|uniref:Hsp20/alpha crystallin family protein n=1 Tax=Alkalilacustris brevis TaxID=2026338 RepID=UPI000E0D7022|nr:Hsp20/alpha crystallin family protein [Alkalilacustris brevis]
MVDKHFVSDFWPQVFEPLRQMGSRLAEFAAPASEASSDEGTYRIALELPGVAEEDIDISVDGGVMTVKGEKKTEREEKTDTWYFSERRYGAFSRSFRLPDDADPENISAALKDGVLTVTLPRKASKSPSSKKVPINRG